MQEPQIVATEADPNTLTSSHGSNSGKKGKKKKKKRGAAKSQGKVMPSLPDPLAGSKDRNAASFGRVSNSGKDITGSYS